MKSEPFFSRILHGGDYNPEQWPEAVWDEDVSLMQEAHVNVATVPVFGWVHLQPDEDTYRFEWLNHLLDNLHTGGISACLATATASVPAWVEQKYPDVLRVERNGQRRKHGGRHTFCPHSPNFRRLSTALARRLAERYAQHPALTVWHISNEYGNYCYCDLCAEAFQQWLQARYGTLEEVNRRWYTAFWGHTYTDWSQIETPTTNGQTILQGMLVDYDRFQSQSILDCFKAEATVLREVTPDIPITTNLMGAFKPLDYHRWAREMDIVSWDSYPRKGAAPAEIAFAHSLMRGLKEGQPFMLMEQTPSQQNWQPYNALKRPGVMRLWSYQAMAHGADTVMYFQWRRSRGAIEKFHGAVVEHVGTSQPRVFQEVAALGRELESLGTRTIGGRVAARVAILFDWENWWALEYSAGPTIDLKYVPQCQAFFTALHNLHIPTDIVSPEADLSHYDLVIAPVLYMVKPGIAEKLEEFTQRGGTFLTTFFSGIVDETDLVYLGGYPGPLRKLLGIWAEEIDALTPQQTNQVVFDAPYETLTGTHSCHLLCDRIHAEGATILATYGEDFYAGEPAVTVNSFGQGEAYYIATALNPEALQAFLQAICERQDIHSALSDIPAEVEVMPRVSPQGETLLYILNHSTETKTVNLPDEKYRDLLTGETYHGSISIPGYGVCILVKEP
ncbi:MAG: beta-galactosidase [Abitibacteriaceae bacterium]|nr:beta-galactosidase [Abditibacteriaceae bacterium]MBV9868313.1 beta-galactosidase [Abditibacteriaceae bacterium]